MTYERRKLAEEKVKLLQMLSAVKNLLAEIRQHQAGTHGFSIVSIKIDYSFGQKGQMLQGLTISDMMDALHYDGVAGKHEMFHEAIIPFLRNKLPLEVERIEQKISLISAKESGHST